MLLCQCATRILIILQNYNNFLIFPCFSQSFVLSFLLLAVSLHIILWIWQLIAKSEISYASANGNGGQMDNTREFGIK